MPSYSGSCGLVWVMDGPDDPPRKWINPFPGFSGRLAVAVSPDNRLLAVGAGEGGGPVFCVYDIASATKIHGDRFAFEPSQTGGVSVAFSPDGRHLEVAGGPGGGPRVQWYQTSDWRLVRDWFLADDPAVTGNRKGVHLAAAAVPVSPPPPVVVAGVPDWFSIGWQGVVAAGTLPPPAQWAELQAHLARLQYAAPWAVPPVLRNNGGISVVYGVPITRAPALNKFAGMTLEDGRKYDKVIGFTVGARAHVVLGRGHEGSVSAPAHEWFHAFDAVLGLSQRPDWSGPNGIWTVLTDPANAARIRAWDNPAFHHPVTGPREFMGEALTRKAFGLPTDKLIDYYWSQLPVVAN